MSFEARTLGRTGLEVGPIGLGSSFGIGDRDLEWAFDRGCNYLYWGSLRTKAFGRGLRTLVRTRRDGLVLVVQSYMRWGFGIRLSLERALRRLRADHADVLLLGLWNKPLPAGVLATAAKLREQGKVRFIAVSTHVRPSVAPYFREAQEVADILHVRYNAAHRGAESEVFPHVGAHRPARPGLVGFTATRWATLTEPQEGVERVPTAADCYRFVLTRPEVDLCLAGPRNRADVVSALEALERGPMDQEELAWMRDVGDRVYAARQGRGETTFLRR